MSEVNCEDIVEEKGILLEEKAREHHETEVKLLEGIFSFQNELLTEMGCEIQKTLEKRNKHVHHKLSELYQQVQTNTQLSRKLQRIQLQTESLHQAVVKPMHL